MNRLRSDPDDWDQLEDYSEIDFDHDNVTNQADSYRSHKRRVNERRRRRLMDRLEETRWLNNQINDWSDDAWETHSVRRNH